MGTKSQAIAWALAQVGETDGGKYWQIVRGYRSTADWCAIFNSANKVVNTFKDPYHPNNFAFDKRDLPVIGSAWHEPLDGQPGDFISYDFDGGGQYGGDHEGFVVERFGPGDYNVVEGNCSRRVQLKHRTIANSKTYNSDGSLRGSGIIGLIRPTYDPEKTIKERLIVDGVFGQLTIKALQECLQKRGYYKGYLVDGDWGYYSKIALQQYLRALGYYTTAWLLDGWFGTASVKALQSYLRALGYYGSGYLIDGDWGKFTTMALQAALNAGRF